MKQDVTRSVYSRAHLWRIQESWPPCRKVVSIGEYATRVICKVDYDSNIDKRRVCVALQ